MAATARRAAVAAAALCGTVASALCDDGSRTCRSDDVAMLQASPPALRSVAISEAEDVAAAAPRQSGGAAVAGPQPAALLGGAVAPGLLHGEEARHAMARLLHERGLQRPEYDSVEVKLPWELGLKPLARCRSPQERAAGHAPSEADASLEKAVDTYCDAGLGDFVEVYVDPRFKATQERLKGADGWINEAFMTYYTATEPHQEVVGEEDLLIQSIHHFSDKPIVVVNYGHRVPKSWTPERYPNMVLMHAKNSTAGPALSFNLNKINCMMFTKIRVGMALDADQFANHGLDLMFKRAAEETTKDYPYPILPVHWMSRDPESSDMSKHPKPWSWIWRDKALLQHPPKQSYRWSHSHPTWTFWALPWMARWTSYVLAPSKTNGPAWLKPQGFWSDEPLLNVAAWAENLPKQWCKYDLTSPGDFGFYIHQYKWDHIHADEKYYPKGIAKVFFTAHAAKDPEDSYKWLTQLWDDSQADKRMAILYDGKWFGSGKALKAYDPNLRCII